MRIVYYALGGGLGHLVRARAFLHTLNLGDDAVVLTASEFARDPRVLGDVEVSLAPQALQHEPAAFRAWLLRELERLRAECLCIDAFAAGILGELCDLPPLRCELWHVARLLRWDVYGPLVSGVPPRFSRVFRVEALSAAHQSWLDVQAGRVEDLTLLDPAVHDTAIDADDPHWLIVHSGPAHEVDQLLALADEMRSAEDAQVSFWVVSGAAPAQLPARTRIIDAHPATGYFAGAQRIFSAAGFNVMRQTHGHRHKHIVMPMQRRFDDQFERARRRAAAHGAPPVTATVPRAALRTPRNCW